MPAGLRRLEAWLIPAGLIRVVCKGAGEAPDGEADFEGDDPVSFALRLTGFGWGLLVSAGF